MPSQRSLLGASLCLAVTALIVAPSAARAQHFESDGVAFAQAVTTGGGSHSFALVGHHGGYRHHAPRGYSYRDYSHSRPYYARPHRYAAPRYVVPYHRGGCYTPSRSFSFGFGFGY